MSAAPSLASLAAPLIMTSLLPVSLTALLLTITTTPRPEPSTAPRFTSPAALRLALLYASTVLLGIAGAVDASSLVARLEDAWDNRTVGVGGGTSAAATAGPYVRWTGLVLLSIYLLVTVGVDLPASSFHHRLRCGCFRSGPKTEAEPPSFPCILVAADLLAMSASLIFLISALLAHLVVLLVSPASPALLIVATSFALSYDATLLFGIGSPLLRRRYLSPRNEPSDERPDPEAVNDNNKKDTNVEQPSISNIALLASSQLLGLTATIVSLYAAIHRAPSDLQHSLVYDGVYRSTAEAMVISVATVARLALLLVRAAADPTPTQTPDASSSDPARQQDQYPDLISLSPAAPHFPRLSLRLPPSTPSSLTARTVLSPTGSSRYVLVDRPLRRSGPRPSHPFATLSYDRAASSPQLRNDATAGTGRRTRRRGSTLSDFNWSDALQHTGSPRLVSTSLASSAGGFVVPAVGLWEDELRLHRQRVEGAWPDEGCGGRQTVPAWLEATQPYLSADGRERCKSAPAELPSLWDGEGPGTDLEILAAGVELEDEGESRHGDDDVEYGGDKTSDIVRLHRQLSFDASQSLASFHTVPASSSAPQSSRTSEPVTTGGDLSSSAASPPWSPGPSSGWIRPSLRSFSAGSSSASLATTPTSPPSPTIGRYMKPPSTSSRSSPTSRLRPSALFRRGGAGGLVGAGLGAGRPESEESFACAGQTPSQSEQDVSEAAAEWWLSPPPTSPLNLSDVTDPAAAPTQDIDAAPPPDRDARRIRRAFRLASHLSSRGASTSSLVGGEAVASGSFVRRYVDGAFGLRRPAGPRASSAAELQGDLASLRGSASEGLGLGLEVGVRPATEDVGSTPSSSGENGGEADHVEDDSREFDHFALEKDVERYYPGLLAASSPPGPASPPDGPVPTSSSPSRDHERSSSAAFDEAAGRRPIRGHLSDLVAASVARSTDDLASR